MSNYDKTKPVSLNNLPPAGWEQLIAAFRIFQTYNPGARWPTHCEHDVMWVACSPGDVSKEDVALLDALGFHAGPHMEGFKSYQYGSA